MVDLTMTSRSSSSISAWSAASACCRVLMARIIPSRPSGVKAAPGGPGRPAASPPLAEGALPVELHERLRARAEARPPAGHGGGLDGLEQLALGRAVLDGPAHVGDHALVPPAIAQDADDHHLPILDRQLLALADRQIAERL